MAEHQLKRKAVMVQLASLKPYVLACGGCGNNMFSYREDGTYYATCYTKECDHDRRIFEVVYPTILLASYTDAPKDA